MRDRSVVEEERQLLAVSGLAPIRPARVQRSRPRPPHTTRLAHAPCLARRQKGESDPLVGEHFERLAVHGGLGKPHPGGFAPESVPEIGEAPPHLGRLVAPAAERENRVPVGLSDRVAVPAGRPARPISAQDRCVDVGTLPLEPRHERGPDVKGEGREVVDDIQDSVLRVHAPRGGVRRVALRGDAGVPVMVRGGGVLDFDALEPRTLTGRLVEVAVDGDEPRGNHRSRHHPQRAETLRAAHSAAG